MLKHDLYSIRNLWNPSRLNRTFLYILDWWLQSMLGQLQVFRHLSKSLQLVMNHKVDYGLIKSKVRIKTRNATRCNNRDDCSTLVSLSKFQYFRGLYKTRWNICNGAFIVKIVSYYVYSQKSSFIDAPLGSKYASAFWGLFKRFITLKYFTL